MLALVDFVDTQLASCDAEVRRLRLALDEALAHEQLCAHRLAEASSATRTEQIRTTRTAIVSLSHASTEDVAIAVEYRVPGARWVPTYRLALADGETPARLTMGAMIAQATGEDWDAVALSLSTASLQRRSELPELASLRIGRAQPQPRRAGWREPPRGLDDLFRDYVAAQRHRPPPPARPTVAQERDTLTPALDEAPSPELRRSMPRRATMSAPVAMPPPPAPAAPLMVGAFAPAAAAAPQDLRASAELALGGTEADPFEDSDSFDDEGEVGEIGGLAMGAKAYGPSADQLEYDTLVMSGPDDDAPGRLVPAVPASEGDDVLASLVREAEREAEEVCALSLPSACTNVGPLARFDYRFDAEAPADVASTQGWTSVTVASCAVALRPGFVCVPAVGPEVYRTLEVHNTSALALLPGPVDVTRGGRFELTTSLPAIAPGARGRRIGLGVEEGIKVARNTRFNEGTGGIFGGQALLQHELDVDVDNRLPIAISLEVRERIPVADASEKDLKIEEGRVEPGWIAVEEPIDGVLVHGARIWRIDVAARSKATLRAQFSIRIPADRMLIGGNRRS